MHLLTYGVAVFVQEEFCGFTADDIKRVSKRASVIGGLRENLLKRSQPAAKVRSVHNQHVRKRKVADAKTVSPHSTPDKMVPSTPSSPLSDSSPPRGSLKGNIKVRLLLGRTNKWLPTPKERRQSDTAMGKVIKNRLSVSHADSIVKEKKKRQRLSSGQSDDSSISSSGESDMKYSLSVGTVVTEPKRGRPALQTATLKRAHARKLVTKAREGLQVEKKPTVHATTRPWAPFWHGRLQLPTQSSRSSRKITINRRLLDGSYTSIGQLGLSQQTQIEQTAVQRPTEDGHSTTKPATADVSSGTRVKGVGLLNRPLGTRPAAKPWRRVQPRDNTELAKPRVRRKKSVSESTGALETKDSTAVAAAVVDDAKMLPTEGLDTFGDKVPPWLKNVHKSVYSCMAKKGSMKAARCYICDNNNIVHHHFMSRVPCCRACARFYKTQCERGTELNQLTCSEKGK